MQIASQKKLSDVLPPNSMAWMSKNQQTGMKFRNGGIQKAAPTVGGRRRLIRGVLARLRSSSGSGGEGDGGGGRRCSSSGDSELVMTNNESISLNPDLRDDGDTSESGFFGDAHNHVLAKENGLSRRELLGVVLNATVSSESIQSSDDSKNSAGRRQYSSTTTNSQRLDMAHRDLRRQEESQPGTVNSTMSGFMDLFYCVPQTSVYQGEDVEVAMSKTKKQPQQQRLPAMPTRQQQQQQQPSQRRGNQLRPAQAPTPQQQQQPQRNDDDENLCGFRTSVA